MVNIGSTSTGGRVLAVKNDLAKIVLIQPVCTQEGEKIALSRRVEKHWRYVSIFLEFSLHFHNFFNIFLYFFHILFSYFSFFFYFFNFLGILYNNYFIDLLDGVKL